jgi:hypothetical protein
VILEMPVAGESGGVADLSEGGFFFVGLEFLQEGLFVDLVFYGCG